MKKKKENMKLQWTKFIVVLVLYLLFLLWLQSWLGLIVIPFIYDAYISKKINWQWWKDAESPVRFIMSWVDALVFALVAVYFINLFFFQNYVIPSSSLEKSLLTGDYLFVSKASYGPRIPQTPLTAPLTQHTMPVLGCKSYIEWPQWDYRRAPGLGKVELNDIVVFNYPAGDTVVSEPRWQPNDFYQMVYGYGQQILQEQGIKPNLDSLPDMQLRKYYELAYNAGHSYIASNPNEYGEIMSRPADRRENYVKRCVGLPGQVLQIKKGRVYTNGHQMFMPQKAQQSYKVTLLQPLPEDLCRELGISREDISEVLSAEGNVIRMPMTAEVKKVLQNRKDLVSSIVKCDEPENYRLYPHTFNTGWTANDYGPIWIPKRGATIQLTPEKLAIYDRCIRVYEGNEVEQRDGKIFINGKLATSYTFKMDYYWMMGDNRDNSLDSRFWGFVPEDHIVGKPIFIWLSLDPDRGWFDGKIRWSRLFRMVDNIK